tara:strand:- start:446 stop:604 length:159 start_codon:yes stop_codon:yes gene_type:complete
MKYLLLFLIIVLVIIIFRFIGNIRKKSELKNKNNNVVDLEKDPQTNEYKPKE